jgi:hypothetical protein
MAHFTYKLLAWGDEWQDKRKRRKLEDKFIVQYADIAYNVARNPLKVKEIINPAPPKILHTDIQFPVIINNVSYDSIRSINRAFKASRNQIKKLMLEAGDVPSGTSLRWDIPYRTKAESQAMQREQATFRRHGEEKLFTGKIMFLGVEYNGVLDAVAATGSFNGQSLLKK